MSTATAEPRLSEQLRNAAEMGYSDAEIWAALDHANKTSHQPYAAFVSHNAMLDALIAVQTGDARKHSRLQLLDSNDEAAEAPARALPRQVTITKLLSNGHKTARRFVTQRCEHSTLDFSWMRSSPRGSFSPTRTLPARYGRAVAAERAARSSTNADFNDQLSNVARSMSFGSLNLRRSPTSSSTLSLTSSPFYLSTTQRTTKSSVQRLIDALENETRRHFDEFQRINADLRRRLETSVQREDALRDLLRERQEKVRQQETRLKEEAETHKRLDTANRRIQELHSLVERRDTELMRAQNRLDDLQRRYEVETRKADEIKNTLNAEIGRLVRESERATFAAQQTEKLKHEFEAKLRIAAQQQEELEREKQALEDARSHDFLCNICMDKRREIILFPCLHFTCCSGCADSMDHCSVCRLRIRGKIEVFQ